MAPTFYHYYPVPMDEYCKGDGGQGQKRSCSWMTVVFVIIIAILSVLLIIFIVKSKACWDSYQVEMKYYNVTQTVAYEDFLKNCNCTVEILEMVKTQCLGKVQELKEEINRLNLTLQDTQAEVDQLKKENEHLRLIKSKDNYESNSGISMKPGPLLLLVLGALLL
ncbi:bone marrow stromal antigen 2-like [Otolemur garnettii]|uniref:bone marrow stromal antigen 2-like n=1 Tax=Otolemur garnettii TaxID=30611 RepID=UPI000644027C|nr:bone marrow stromal antigen 2-like [Otolemur garnettii]